LKTGGNFESEFRRATDRRHNAEGQVAEQEDKKLEDKEARR
jgi:hypothetical protein